MRGSVIQLRKSFARTASVQFHGSLWLPHWMHQVSIGKAKETRGGGFSQCILSPDFKHGKKLAEMAPGEFGIGGEPELSARLCGSDDSTLGSG
jgi:hypothetical protein